MVESTEQELEQAKQLALIGLKMDTLIEEVSSLRHVVVGNGDSNSLVTQVNELKINTAVAQKDRERIERRVNEVADCVSKLERGGIVDTNSLINLAKDITLIKAEQAGQKKEQAAQGKLIAAFRNRVIGIVAVLSLLAGAGAGFVAAAKLLSAAVP